jgi:hypothetical protein
MDESRDKADEIIDGVRLHYYSAFTKLVLDKGKGDDWAEHITIEVFNNAGHTISFGVEGPEVGSPAEGDEGGDAFFTLTPAEARWLAKKLISDADEAERRLVENHSRA